VNYNDADLCRARAGGYTVLYEPAALLPHDEGRSRAPGVRLQGTGPAVRAVGGLAATGRPFLQSKPCP
jgi:hypothetical protein